MAFKKGDNIGAKNPRWIGGKIALVCLFCKKEFKAYAIHKKKFCSPKCGNINKRNRPTSKRNGSFIPCKVCRKEFYRPPSQMLENNYCSLMCLYSIRLGKPNFGNRGIKNGNWRDGITPALTKIRESLEYDIWRRKVFEYDNYTCIWCGIKGGWSKKLKKQIILNADHIKSFALYPELRFELNNGRTLCETCHKKTPTFGKLLKHQIMDVL